MSFGVFYNACQSWEFDCLPTSHYFSTHLTAVTLTEPSNHNGPALVRLNHIRKSYRALAGEIPILHDINLELNAGEFVGIIGKSGSGKSTLLNMITGIDRPTSGEVWIGDVPIHKLSEGQMAVWRGQHLGIIFQFFQLLPMLSLVENVMLPMDFAGRYSSSQRSGRAMQLLDLVELADHAHKLPSALRRSATACGHCTRSRQRPASPRRR